MKGNILDFSAILSILNVKRGLPLFLNKKKSHRN